MSTNLFFTHQKTVPIVPIPISQVQEEDEDTDICPVCDGQCTCHFTTTALSSNPLALQPTHVQIQSIKEKKTPLTMAELSIKYSAATAVVSGSSLQQPTTPASAPLSKPSLKIKFTVPQTLLAKQKRRLGLGASSPSATRAGGGRQRPKGSSKNRTETTSEGVNDGYTYPYGYDDDHASYSFASDGYTTPPPSFLHSHSHSRLSPPTSSLGPPPQPQPLQPQKKKRGRPPKVNNTTAGAGARGSGTGVVTPSNSSGTATGCQTGTRNKNKLHQGASSTAGLHKRSSTKTTSNVATKQKSKTKQKQKQDIIKARAASIVKRVSGRRKKRLSKYDHDDEDEESSSASASDVEMEYADGYGDGHPYPTFVSASALESFESGSGSDSCSDLSPLDGEIEEEEENFIIGEEREKARERARTRRELLGDLYHQHHNPHNYHQNQNHNNEWVIHSRKRSVGLSEGEEGMDVDSDDDDGSDDPEEEEDEEDGDHDGEGPTSSATTLAPPGDDTQIDSSTDTGRKRQYLRLGTSWTLSSSDESNVDADLFFRHLYDSFSSSSSGDESDANVCAAGGEDSDADTQIASEGEIEDAVANVVELESLPFELAESWDGGVVFTNGNGVASGDARGDFGFMGGFGDGFGPGIGRGRKGKEKATFGFGGFGDAMEMSMSMSGCSSDGYLEEDGECEEDSFMFDDEDDSFSFTACGGAVAGVDDDALFDDEGEGSGETTDEDLVGADLLPNERAMRLFKLPSPMWGAVGAVDPLSLFARGDGSGRRRGRKKRKGKARDNRKGKKPREMLSPLDILAGRVVLWDSQDDMDLDDDFCSASHEEDLTSLDASPSNPIPIRKQSRLRPRATSPRTPTPTPTTSPGSTVTTSTRTGSRFIPMFSGPRKGVFVLPTPPGGLSEETSRDLTQQQKKAVVVIDEDRKGADVPSPHPRRAASGVGKGANGGSVDGANVVEQLLRRHLAETLGSINTPNDHKAFSTNATNGGVLLPPPFSPPTLDESMSSSIEVALPHHSHTHSLEVDIPRPFGLDDVLDTTFLNGDDDDEDEEYMFNMTKATEKVGIIVRSSAEEYGSEGISASTLDESLPPPSTSSESDLPTIKPINTPLSLQATTVVTSDADAAADAAAAKNLSRWDVISVGAFRQTQIQGDGVGHGHGAITSATAPSRHGGTPASSADFGNAMKSSSPLTMLWRGSSGQGQNQKGSSRRTSGNGSNGAGGAAGPSSMRRTASGGNIVNGKHAKKRRLMMSGTGGMSLPLVLPSNSSAGGGARERTPTPTTVTTTMTGPGTGSSPNSNNKTRKEARRERKHQKRKGYPSGVGPHHHQASSSYHHHHHQGQHPHHTYHQHHHHPNAKTRGVSSLQRLGSSGSGWGNGGGGGHGYGGGGHSGGGWGIGGGGGGFVPMGL